MIKLLFAGDFIPPETSQNLYSDELKKILQDKDFSIVNLETPLTTINKAIKKTGNNFKRHPDAINHIKNGFFDAVTLSNNHIRDYGDAGVMDTIETCNQNNILTVGAGKNLEDAAKPLRLNIKGKKISILNYSEREFNIAGENSAGANPFDLIDAFHQIKTEKEENDVVIVVYHGGLEFHHVPLPGIKRNLEYLAEIGADAIVCHHSHYISGYSCFNERPIFYGLGNFFYKSRSNFHLKNKNLHQGLLLKLLLNEKSILFDLKFVIKSEDQSVLNVVSDSEFLKSNPSFFENINEIISDAVKLNNYWIKQYPKYAIKYYLLFKDYGLLGKIVKKINIIFPLMVSMFYKKRIASLLRCESHRQLITNSFEYIEKKKNV